MDGKSAISPYTAIIMSGKLYLSQTSANSRTVRLVIKNENFLLPTQIDVELQVARYGKKQDLFTLITFSSFLQIIWNQDTLWYHNHSCRSRNCANNHNQYYGLLYQYIIVFFLSSSVF